QPLGRAVNLTQAIDRDDPRDGARRLHLLITPDPAIRQPAIDAWTDSGTEPRWLVSGERIVTLLLSQHLYDAMRQLEKTNSRVSWLRELEAALGAIIDGTAPDATAALNEVIASIEHQKDTLYEDTGHATAPPPPTTPARAALRRALELATGEKEYIELSVVTQIKERDVSAHAGGLG